MKKKRNSQSPKKMKPVFLVFCEGDTEETYINFLRLMYRLPIKVIPHRTGLSISSDIIKQYTQEEKIGPSDKITSFLMYDLDRDDVAKKLISCKNSINISTNPCVELWFLLHTGEQNSIISTIRCIEKLEKSSPDWATYKKGSLSRKQKQDLWDNRKLASARARKLPEGKNPSSSVYRLIEAMENTDPGAFFRGNAGKREPLS